MRDVEDRTWARGWSLLQMGVRGGINLAGLKCQDWLGKSGAEERWQIFLESQASRCAGELGKLKGSLMKVGQLLSVYGEHLLPREIVHMFRELQAQSQPLPWQPMEKVLVEELGMDILRQWDIDPEPIASASIGQVYKVQFQNQILAVKIQYPGIHKAIESDLKLLKSFLFWSQWLPSSYKFDNLFQEIRTILHHETDYEREAQMMERYGEWLKNDERFVVPKVHRNWTTSKVLTMDFEDGMNLADCAKDHSQQEIDALGLAFLELAFKEFFHWFYVQTDPHFGNYAVRLSKSQKIHSIVLYDFGAVRRFPKSYVSSVARLFQASQKNHKEAACREGEKMGFLSPDDSQEVRDLFFRICLAASEPFGEIYDWGSSDLLLRLSSLAKEAVLGLHLRPPPREALLAHRKWIGLFVILSKIGMKLGGYSVVQPLEHY